MTEKDILNLISADPWMMGILRVAKNQKLPDWMVGAGFVRNKVWDHLHGFENERVPTNDIDLIYFDTICLDRDINRALSAKLTKESGTKWEVVNQAYTHTWHNRLPYKNTEEALADCVETPTCVAVSMLDNEKLKLHAPLGINDLVGLVVRRNEAYSDSISYENRVTSKKWQEKWPKLQIIHDEVN